MRFLPWRTPASVCAVLLAAVSMGKAQNGATQPCATATLSGSYGYLLQGDLVSQGSLEPYADMGILTTDGKGNLTGTGTESLAGQIYSATTISGSYIVNSDCTGSASLTYSTGATFHYNVVVQNNGHDLKFLQNDNGSIVSGSARLQQETNCVLGSLDGSYAFTISGSFIDSTGSANPYLESGTITFNGSGSISVTGGISEVGTLTSLNASGSYATHSNCTGTLSFTDPVLGALHMNLAVVNGGQEFRVIDSDTGLILSGIATALGNLAPGGTMAHLASGGGWVTTFTLTNSGSTAASITLSFFGDDGNPVSLPLTLPDSGNNSNTEALTETIESGATLVVATNAPNKAALVTGSAELSSQGGNVSGFAVFHYNPNTQEAVVPLETRNASAYVLAFDNTKGLTTGLALANVSGQPAKVPMIVRDDKGDQLGTATITLPAHGHTSFLLAASYGFAQNKRGTVEFDAPSISVLGIRSGPALTFTTIPALVK